MRMGTIYLDSQIFMDLQGICGHNYSEFAVIEIAFMEFDSRASCPNLWRIVFLVFIFELPLMARSP